jgi:hypothetical protein
MPLVTSQQITKYFQLYKAVDVTFNKDVTKAIGLLSKQIFMKILGEQVPCILYSSSLSGAKIIASVTQEMNERIRRANNVINIRYSFTQPDKAAPLIFFMTAKVTGFTPYGKDKGDLTFISCEFTQRPPDDLIVILGRLLDASIASTKRKEERIPMQDKTMRNLGIRTKEIVLYVDNLPRRGILRNISFSGAQVIIPGVAKLLMNKSAILRVISDSGTFNLPGVINRFDEVQGRKDIASVAIAFGEKQIPLEYKMLLNDFFQTHGKSLHPQESGDQEEKDDNKTQNNG